MQLMYTMAATGMGADTPPSESTRLLPALGASPANDDDEKEEKEEDKRDYRADDEDEDEEDEDNSFDYIPVNALTINSESSEDFGADIVRKAGGVDLSESVKQVLVRTDGDVATEPVALATDTGVLQKVDVERHTVIQDTTIVKKYSCVAAEGEGKTPDESQQGNKLMAVTVSSSSAVIDRATSSTLESAATEVTKELSDGTSSYISSDSSQDYSGEEVLNLKQLKDKPKGSSSLDGGDEEMDDDGEEEQKSPVNVPSTRDEEEHSEEEETMEVEPEEDLVIETPQSVEADEEKNDTTQDENQQQLQESETIAAAPLDITERQTGAKGKLKATKASKSAKRKQNLSPPPRDLAESILNAVKGNDAGHTSAATAASTPTHTPKRSARGSSKKQKKAPTTAETPLRRSSRIKVEPPKFTYPVKILADEAVMTHFDRVGGSGASSPATPVMVCKHCGNRVTTSRGVAARHLKACPAFDLQERGVSQLNEADDNEDKAAAPASPAAKLMQGVKSEASSSQPARPSGLVMQLVQLMGTEALATKLKPAFQRAPFAGNAPISRFQELIRDDVIGLRHLRVFNLLDAVNPLDGPIMQLHVKLPGVRRSTGQDRVDSVSKAKARSLENCPLRFPAARSVAEQFIVPLAKELGLEYAMRQHTASLMSCPLEGAVLDWRFHRTETVIFQLRGKALWKVKMSQVEHPRQCFHPDSWLLDDMTHVAKVHRVATMDKASLGFLSTPGEDLDVFDESGDRVATDQQDHMLKPGSVAYLPAGAWFEVETQGSNTLWLEVQLASLTYEDLAFSALKQLAWGDKQWRMGVQLCPGNRGQIKAIRHHMEACIKSLRSEMTELEGGDLLPEYLGTEDMQDLVAQGLIQDTSTSPNSTSIEVDLTNPGFKLKHEKVFKGAAYRVNPVAVLMSAVEIPHLPFQEEAEQAAGHGRDSDTTQMPHRALKKTPKPKPKRKQTLRVLTHTTGKHTYMLDELFGNSEFQSQLHVKFQCSAEQSRMVEWLRCRGLEPFDLVEFSSCDSGLSRGKSPARCEESARNLLRFLCFVGYVTQVKSP